MQADLEAKERKHALQKKGINFEGAQHMGTASTMQQHWATNQQQQQQRHTGGSSSSKPHESGVICASSLQQQRFC